MTKKRQWTTRRGGQVDATAAIAQVVERQPDEPIQQVPDALIGASPYQARQTEDEAALDALAQSMQEAGFQGVLFARPHPQQDQQSRGVLQLVYGHRRRLAWRRVCAARGIPCIVPVVVRPYTDAQVLTIGAQENLQRRDLDPVEEAQIVAWHQQVYWEKNQTEIAALLGKSTDWVKTRSRVAQLPDDLKAPLRQRPRAVSQILEIAAIADAAPDLARDLATRVVTENLTLDAVRQLVRNYTRPTPSLDPVSQDRDSVHKQRGTAPLVNEDTNTAADESPPAPGPPPAARPRTTAPPDTPAPYITRDLATMQTILQRWATYKTTDATAVHAAVQRIIADLTDLLTDES